MKEIKTFTMFGDASVELKKLYSEGWRLVTAVTPFASAIPVRKTTENAPGEMLYLYAVEYFMERGQ